jgi:hypothetical protein
MMRGISFEHLLAELSVLAGNGKKIAISE